MPGANGWKINPRMIMPPSLSLNGDRRFFRQVRRLLRSPFTFQFRVDDERRLREEAEKSHASLRAVIGHELREPLAPLLAEIDLLISEPHAAPCREGLQVIRKHVEREAELISTICDRYAPDTVAPSLLKSFGARPRILLVDDHADTRQTFTRVFWKSGFCVVAVATVDAAINVARRGDFLICDIGLEDGSGFDVIRALVCLGIRGIAMSGYGAEADHAASIAAGFSEHMTKPVDVKEIFRAIQQYWEVPLN